MQKKLDADLIKLNRQKSDRILRFGDNMGKLLEECKKNERRFKTLPIGPVGLYLNVKDPKWVNAVECHVSGYISSFIVATLEDKEILKDLMNKTACVQDIIVTPLEKYEYSIPADVLPDPSLLTIRKAIDCSDPNVMNMLIDQRMIEKSCTCT